MSTGIDPDVIELSREEIVRRLERGARASRRQSARKFAEAYFRGELQEPCEVAGLVALLLLLPREDRLLAGLTGD